MNHEVTRHLKTVDRVAAEETAIRSLEKIIVCAKEEIEKLYPCRCELTFQGLQRCRRCIALET